MIGRKLLIIKKSICNEQTLTSFVLIQRSRVMKKQIEIHKIDISSNLPLQYADEGIKAGFPSPAQDYLEQAIDLNKELIRHG